MMKDNENKLENGGGDQILMCVVQEAYQKLRGEVEIDFSNLLTSGLNRAYNHAFILSYTFRDTSSNLHTMKLSL